MKLQYGPLQFLNLRGVQYLFKENVCVKVPFQVYKKKQYVNLSCPGCHIIFYRLNRTSLFCTESSKKPSLIILKCFSLKMRMTLKQSFLLISHIIIAISVQIITIRFFLQNHAVELNLLTYFFFFYMRFERLLRINQEAQVFKLRDTKKAKLSYIELNAWLI